MTPKATLIQKKRNFSVLFFLVFFGVIFYISGLLGILKIILSLCIYSLLAYLFYLIWKKLRKKDFLLYPIFLEYFLYKVSWGILLSIIIIGGFSYYKNNISPTPMPTYHISNGEKKVIFQAMSHIGTQKFYDSIKQNLSNKKKEGYVYFYEGVKPGTQKNMKNFDKAMGIKFDKNLYENFSKLYGVVHQDNSLFLNLINNKDYNVDLSIDEIMKLYEKNTTDTNRESNPNILQNKDVIDANAEIVKTLASLNEKELSILRYINKALLNFMVGSESTQNLVIDNFANKKLFQIILDERNKVLAKSIIDSKNDKIFVTYGLLHFKGVLNILQNQNQNWEITNIKYSYPIK